MHPQIIVPGRAPVWRPGFDEETYEKSRIIVPERSRRAPQRAAISLVANTGAQGDSSGTTTGTIDSSAANLLVLGVCFYDLTADPVISDSKSNTWNALTKQTLGGGTGACCLYWCSGSINVGSGHTFSALRAASYASLAVIAFSGSVSSAFDQENGAAVAPGTSQQPGSVTPSQDNEVLVTVLNPNTGTGATINSSYSITNQANIQAGVSFGHNLAYLIQTTAGASNPTWSWTGSAPACASIATFKASAGGGGTPLFRSSLLNGLGSGGPYFNNPLG